MHALNCDERVFATLAGHEPTRAETEAQVARWLAHWERHGFGVFVLEERESGRFVGRCGPAYHRLWPEHPELGWALLPELWGRGYATEAGAACLPLLFDELGFERVVSIVRPDNGRSIAVQTRLGFEEWREVPWDDTGIVLQVRSLTRDARRSGPRPTRPGVECG